MSTVLLLIPETYQEHMQALLKRNKHWNNAPAITAFAHRRSVTLEGKMEICQKQQN